MRRQKNQDWLFELKTGKKCLHCAETDPRCLIWHHREPESKSFKVSIMALKGYSRERILQEVEKCDLICANCHLKLYHGRRI